jgi:hypothetical protein
VPKKPSPVLRLYISVPERIPISSENITCFVINARVMAMRGGIIDRNPA